MIITKLSGGLGNQMFQYACGRALALRNEDELKLDIMAYVKPNGIDIVRDYNLSRFNILENIASEKEIEKARFPRGPVSKFSELFRKKILRRFNVGFVPGIVHKKTKGGITYLDGFWQTERYFADCGDAIRKDFTLKKPLGPAARAIANLISSNGPSVSIHIRQGDMAHGPAKSHYSGIATPEYYSRALVHMATKIKNFRVFVFSDDIEWTKKNITIPYPTRYVSAKKKNGDIRDYEEMTLMSMCDHNIIANSSFSWWGAWLNKNPQKVVIAPTKWLNVHQKWHADTVPETWIRL